MSANGATKADLRKAIESQAMMIARLEAEKHIIQTALGACAGHLPGMVCSADIASCKWCGQNVCCSTNRYCAKCARQMAKEALAL